MQSWNMSRENLLIKKKSPGHFVQDILSTTFWPRHFVLDIMSTTFCSRHHVHDILSMTFCPMTFCSHNILSATFCPWHFVRWHFVRPPKSRYYYLYIRNSYVRLTIILWPETTRRKFQLFLPDLSSVLETTCMHITAWQICFIHLFIIINPSDQPVISQIDELRTPDGIYNWQVHPWAIILW